MEKKGVFGPEDCEDTIAFAENLPFYVADILRRHGHDIDPEQIRTPSGTRYSSSNLEEGVAIPGVMTNRRVIRRDILNEIGRMPVVFVPAERQSASSPYQQKQILEYC
jgi:hypothetical protein